MMSSPGLELPIEPDLDAPLSPRARLGGCWRVVFCRHNPGHHLSRHSIGK